MPRSKLVPAVQLDIFDHSRDVMLRNDVLAALQRFDAGAAGAAWQRLEQEFPADDALAPLRVLVDAVMRRTDEPFADHDGACAAVHELAEVVLPAARRLLGDSAAEGWLAPQWGQAAQRGASLSYQPAHAQAHCVALWLRAGNWRAAADAVARIPSWRRIPVPLGWMTQARLRLEGVDATWPLITELAWLAPARLEALWSALDDPLLGKLRRQFDAEFDGTGGSEDLAWFPAWLLTHKSGLARALGAAQPSGHREPEQALRLLVECIGLERQGRQQDLVACRKRLRGLHQGLYESYIRIR